jgi:hypothetical protein
MDSGDPATLRERKRGFKPFLGAMRQISQATLVGKASIVGEGKVPRSERSARETLQKSHIAFLLHAING